MKKIDIVGAGPAGLFAAYELCHYDCDITIIEQADYVGGSGLHSDGKLNFHPKIGGDLTEFMSESDAWKLINHIKCIFEDIGKVEIPQYDAGKLEILEQLAAKAGIKYIPIHQAHIGSDFLPQVMNRLQTYLENHGVKICLERKTTSINPFTDTHILLAPGRRGSKWMVRELNNLNVKMKYSPIDIGVRIETTNEVMKEITDVCWDPKFHIYTDSYDDFLRTFCSCPSGFVVKESYGDSLFGVNGHSMKNKRSNNTNFALLCSVNLTEPLENTTQYGTRLAQLINTLGGRKPIIQRLGDLKKNRRSTWDRIDKSYVEPTLKDVTPGDISMGYPKRIIHNILEGLEKLDKIIPGINSSSTLLYAPEIKFYSMKIDTDKTLKIPGYPISVAGDGAGVSRGIIGAAATGIIAARGIINQKR